MNSSKLLNGDCLELLKDVKEKSVSLILADLPYETTKMGWDIALPPGEMWESFWRVLEDDGVIVLFGTHPFTNTLINSQSKYFRYEWIWVKDSGIGFLNAKKMPMKKHEHILVFYKKLPTYNPQCLLPFNKTIKTRKKFTEDSALGKIGVKNLGGEFVQQFTNYPTSILNFSNEKGFHPTQKPVPLLEYLINTYTNPGELVLDPTMGSGSTGVAASNVGRNFIGIELDETFFNIAKDRINITEK